MRDLVVTLVSRILGILLRPRMEPATLEAPRRILIVKSCCLGDVLLTTPLLHALRQRFPEAEITYAVGAWSRPMIASSQDVDVVLTIPDRWTVGSLMAVARTLYERQFDAVFVPERTPLPGILTLLAGIPIRVGLDSQGRGFAYTHPVYVPPTIIHEADLYLSLAEQVGIKLQERRLYFFPGARDREYAHQIVSDLHDQRPIVVIHPGGGSNPGMTLPSKRWLSERWATVADELARSRNARIVIVGSADEHVVATAVSNAMLTSATVITQQWQWGTLAAVIERAMLFLGHDTGMMHLAQAVGTPVVVVFGPSDPQIYGPYSKPSRFVWHPTPESPCFHNGVAPAMCPCDGQCMRNVEVDNVFEAVNLVVGVQTGDT